MFLQCNLEVLYYALNSASINMYSRLGVPYYASDYAAAWEAYIMLLVVQVESPPSIFTSAAWQACIYHASKSETNQDFASTVTLQPGSPILCF
jgi:hypothetical protein